MRTVATLSPQFWIGETGRQLRPPADRPKAERESYKDARIVATYLTNAPSSSMYGLYYVTARTIAEETGLYEGEVRAAMVLLDSLDYARYDQRTEFVWVVQMAWHQLNCPLKPGDRRVANVNTWYRALPKNPWLGPFFDRYKDACLLEERRDTPSSAPPAMPLLRDVTGAGSPFDGAKDLRPVPVPVQEGVQGKPKPKGEAEALGQWFHEFHAAYPSNRRVGGEKGQRAFTEALRKATPKGGSLEDTWGVVRRSLEHHKSSEQWQTERLVPSMTKWLSEHRWHQELEQAKGGRKVVTPPATGLWGEILGRMEAKLGRSAYFTWFKPLTVAKENGQTLTLLVGNPEAEGWIRKHHSEQLREACAEVGRPELEIKFTTSS